LPLEKGNEWRREFDFGLYDFLVRFEFFTMHIYYFSQKILQRVEKWVFSLPPHMNVFELISEKKSF